MATLPQQLPLVFRREVVFIQKEETRDTALRRSYSCPYMTEYRFTQCINMKNRTIVVGLPFWLKNLANFAVKVNMSAVVRLHDFIRILRKAY